MIRWRPAVLVAGLLAASACALLPGKAKEAPAPRQSPARDSLLAFDLRRSDSLPRRGLASTIRPLLDPSVIYLRAGANPSYGIERTVRLIEAPKPQTPAFIAWQPIGGGVSRDRLTGYTFGIAVRAQPELSNLLIERYIAVWSRSRGAPWRIAAYIEVSPGSLSSLAGEKASLIIDTRKPLHDLFVADSLFGERAASLGPATAMRDFLSDDGVLLATTQLVVGPRDASEYFQSRRSFSVSWIPREARIAASGDLGYTIGDAVATSLSASGVAQQRFTKYLTVWRKDDDGRWRVAVTGANDRPNPIGD